MIKNNNSLNWRKVTILSVGFLMGILVITSCKKEESTIGDSINPNELNVITTDTFTVQTYSEKLDSIPTDETSISLLGAIKDPEFGLTDCGIVSQIRLSSENPNFGDVSAITVDSVILSFVYAGRKYYGDLTNLTFEVYQINDQLNVDDDYYAFTPVTTIGSNLVKSGTETILPKPSTDVVVGSDTLSPQLRLQLETTFGDYLIANSNEMSSNDNFTSFFKGLYVKVINTSTLQNGEGTVLYFALEDALSKMVIYYSQAGTQKTYSFNINSKCARYNKISVDRTGTPVETVLNNPTLGQERYYLQGTLIRPELRFPHIKDLNNGGRAIINKAILIVPIQDYGGDPFPPVSQLFIAKVSDKYISDFVKDYQSYNAVVYDSENKQFKFKLTREIQAILDGDTENVGVRLFPTNFFGSTIERVIFNGANSSLKNKTRLEITYTKY
jgi:hypothetical protein